MSKYLSPYWYGNQPYREYLQKAEFVKDITDSNQSVQYAISEHSRATIATAEELRAQHMELHQQRMEQDQQHMELVRGQTEAMESVASGIDKLGSDIADGLEVISFGIKEVSQGIAQLDATMSWGFSGTIAAIGRVNDSLGQLISIAKTPAQAWAYEQFEIARDAMRKKLFPEALEALHHAIGGLGDHTGYKLEFRFHHTLGVLHLGDVENVDPQVMDLPKAEAAFLTAARYAKSDYPAEAGVALTAAGWAAYCQGKIDAALDYSQQAVALHPKLGEAFFQMAKVQMHRDQSGLALTNLRRAMDLDRNYSLKAAVDPDFQKYQTKLDAFLEDRRRDLMARARELIVKTEERVDQVRSLVGLVQEWQAEHVAAKEFQEACEALESGKHDLSYNTLYGALDAIEAFERAGTSAQKAYEAKDVVYQAKMTEVKRQADALLEDSVSKIDVFRSSATDHAPKSFADLTESIDAVKQRKANSRTGSDYRVVISDLKSIQESIGNIRKFSADRSKAARSVPSHNAGLLKEAIYKTLWLYFCSIIASPILYFIVGNLSNNTDQTMTPETNATIICLVLFWLACALFYYFDYQDKKEKLPPKR